MPGREEEKGKPGQGKTACRAGRLGEHESFHVPGAKAGAVPVAQTNHEGLTGQAEELELDSAGGREQREVLKQDKAGTG